MIELCTTYLKIYQAEHKKQDRNKSRDKYPEYEYKEKINMKIFIYINIYLF